MPAAEVIAKKRANRDQEFTKEEMDLEEKMILDS